MVGTLTSVASLTIGLAVTNAFVLRAPTVTPLTGSAWTKQASSSLGAPLAGDGTKMGVSGTLYPIDGDDAAESEKKRLPRVPSAEDHASLGSGSIYPLHAFKGLAEADITEDGNATVPIVGGVDSVEGEDTTQHELIEDGNATVSIIGAVDGGEGGDSGVASAPQDEAAVQYRITVTMEGLSSRETFFEEQESITVIASAAHESASTTQEEDDDSSHGVSEDADIADDAKLVTDTDANLATDVDIATDANLTTDVDLESPNQQPLSHEASSDAIDYERRQIINVDNAFGEEGPFDFADDGLIDELSLSPLCPELVEYAAADEMASALNDTDNSSAFDEEHPFKLAADGLGDEMNSTVPFDLVVTEDADDVEMNSMPHDEDVLDDETTSVPHDALSDGAAPEEVVSDDPVNDLVLSVMSDAFSVGRASKGLLLDGATNDMMRTALFEAITGRAPYDPVNAADLLDFMVTCLLHDAFFGSAASEAVSSLAKSTGGSVGRDYVREVTELYDKFKEMRHPTAPFATDDEELVFHLIADDDVIDETGIGSSGPDMPDDAVDEFMRSVRHVIQYDTFNEELVFNLIADDDVIDEVFLWPFDFVTAEGTLADDTTPGLYDDISDDGAATKPEVFDEPVNDLVLSVLGDALTRGLTCKGFILHDALDNLMWCKIHRVISGREASDVADLADDLDAILTSLMHDAFFGQAAFKAVSSLAKSADDSEWVVGDYVKAVARLYANFKKAKGGKSESEAPAVPKAGKRGGGWLNKIWRRIRRKGR